MNTNILFPHFLTTRLTPKGQLSLALLRFCLNCLQTFWIHSAPWIRTEALNQRHFIVSQRVDLLMNTSL